MNKNKRIKKTHKYLEKREYCLNQRRSKWKLLAVTMKQRNVIKK